MADGKINVQKWTYSALRIMNITQNSGYWIIHNSPLDLALKLKSRVTQSNATKPQFNHKQNALKMKQINDDCP
jgi:hypothetical protein